MHFLDTISPHFATALMIWLLENTVHDPQSKFRYSLGGHRDVLLFVCLPIFNTICVSSSVHIRCLELTRRNFVTAPRQHNISADKQVTTVPEIYEALVPRTTYQNLKMLCQFSLDGRSCPTLCYPMDCSTPGLPVHQQLSELAQPHVHRVSDAIKPSHPLSSPSPPAFNHSQYQNFSQ